MRTTLCVFFLVMATTGTQSVQSQALRGASSLLSDSANVTVQIGNQRIQVTLKELSQFFAGAPDFSNKYAETRINADLDIFWLLFGAALVFMMQAGFAMLEVGSVSVKNTKNILVKNLFDASLGAIAFWACGFAFAMGSGSPFIGTTGFFLKGSDFAATGPEEMYNGSQYATWMFQFAFAATAATIVSGSVAERVSFHGYIVYTTLLTLFIYPVVAHWGWSGDGWASAWKDLQADKLFGVGVLDFAGSGVVHMTGGVAALCGAVMVGPRTARFTEDGECLPKPQQSPVFQCLGTLILWFGWYGFNCASTLALSGGLSSVAAKTAVTTTVAAAASGVVAIPASKLLTGGVDPGLLNNCILAGLVAVTSGCATMEPEGAFVTGLVAAPLYFGVSALLRKLRVDDVVDAVPVHFANGFWGVIAAGLFSTQDGYKAAYYDYGANTPCGLFYGCGATQLGANFVFALAVIAWAGTLCTLMFFIIHKTIGLRVSKSHELAGMDTTEHGGASYPEYALAKQQSISAGKAYAVGQAAAAGSGEGSKVHAWSDK